MQETEVRSQRFFVSASCHGVVSNEAGSAFSVVESPVLLPIRVNLLHLRNLRHLWTNSFLVPTEDRGNEANVHTPAGVR